MFTHGLICFFCTWSQKKLKRFDSQAQIANENLSRLSLYMNLSEKQHSLEFTSTATIPQDILGNPR